MIAVPGPGEGYREVEVAGGATVEERLEVAVAEVARDGQQVARWWVDPPRVQRGLRGHYSYEVRRFHLIVAPPRSAT